MSESTLGDVIQKRTDGERAAYIAGYAAAMNACNEHGIERAVSFLRAMVDAEGIIQEREAT